MGSHVKKTLSPLEKNRLEVGRSLYGTGALLQVLQKTIYSLVFLFFFFGSVLRIILHVLYNFHPVWTLVASSLLGDVNVGIAASAG